MKNQHVDILHIWESFQLGDKEAFAYLYNKHVDTLFRYGSKLSKNSELVLDSIQEVFLDLYLKRERNKTNPENLKYYLILSLKRNIVKKLKKNRKLVLNENSLDDQLFEPVYSIERKIIEAESNTEINKRILNALNNLPAKQKEAIYLRFNESMDYKEIASVLGISVESVRKQVYRALKKVKDSMSKAKIVLFSIFLKQQ